MAALLPPGGGLPNVSRRSFAEVLSAKGFAQPSPGRSAPDGPFSIRSGLRNGYPAAHITKEQLEEVSAIFAWSLVGKFSVGYKSKAPETGRPSLERIHQFFLSINLKGDFNVGLLDNRHVVIHLSLEEDYLRLYSKMIWYIGKIVMRICRWTPHFRVDKESSLVPVWVSLPRLPIMLFQQRILFPIARLIGCPLRLDEATETMKRPSIARLLIEVDLLKPRPDRIWIQLREEDGYWQRIVYENVPDYCSNCWHVGHSELLCRRNLNLLPPVDAKSDAQLPQQRQVWNIKTVPSAQPPNQAVSSALPNVLDAPAVLNSQSVEATPEIAASGKKTVVDAGPHTVPVVQALQTILSNLNDPVSDCVISEVSPSPIVERNIQQTDLISHLQAQQPLIAQDVGFTPHVVQFQPGPKDSSPLVGFANPGGTDPEVVETIVINDSSVVHVLSCANAEPIAPSAPTKEAQQVLMVHPAKKPVIFCADSSTDGEDDLLATNDPGHGSQSPLAVDNPTPSKFKFSISLDDGIVGVRPNSKMARMMSKITSPNYLEPLRRDSLGPKAPQAALITEKIAHEPPISLADKFANDNDFEGSDNTLVPEDFEGSEITDTREESLFDVNVAEEDFPKKRGRGRPRKNKN